MPETTRQLVAIMFTDMVGYTALMQRNEQLGIQKRNRHREVLEQQHQKFHGKIIQYFGDGTLSIFSNSSDAVACAVAIQKGLKHPIEVPMRIGIHCGDVLVSESDIIGDAVNIASRIESFANVGGVLISDSVQDQVKNQPQWDFVSLGKFTLKNVERPFEIFAVSSDGLSVPDPGFLKGKGERFATLKSTVPEPATQILGRGKEVGDIIELLNKHRVVTITGTGGMGKTRLSLEICKRLKSNFQDGIGFVSMATLTDAKEVMPTLSSALDIKEAGGRKMVRGVADLIMDKKAFLVLDNLEHVIAAAHEIAELISLCPNLKILCTSRTPLKIEAEQEYALHPLPLPANREYVPDVMGRYPAIDLFVKRANRVSLDFELTEENTSAVIEICQRMDGLPLALELAAARIRVLSPEQLLERLVRALDVLTTGSKDLPERHQTLRATIGWSHSLLNEAEKQLFRRLAIFAGGFTLEAVETICYEDEDQAFLAIDKLESLIDKGLVEVDSNSNRFGLLQTIKDYATEKLKQSDELQAISENHALFYFKLAKTIHKGTQGEQQLLRLKMGNQEEANMQVSLDYLLARAQQGDEEAKETGLCFCGELWMYWHIRGKHVTAKNVINSFLESTDDQTPSLGKSQALNTTVVCHWMLGEFKKCKELALLQYSIAEEIQNELEMGKASLNMVFGTMFLDIEMAKKYAQETLTRFQKLAKDYWLGIAFWINGVISVLNQDLEIAKTRFQECLRLNQKIGDNELQGGGLSGLAMLKDLEGDYQEAINLYQQALSAYELIGDRAEEARILYEVLWVYLALGDTDTALRHTLESIQAYQEVGSTRGTGISMIGLAAIQTVLGNPRRALEIASAAEYLAEQEGIVNFYGANNQGIAYLDNARKQLSETEIDNAVAFGRGITLKEILASTVYESPLTT